MADATRLVAILILVVIGALGLTWFLWTAAYLTGVRTLIYEYRPRRRLRTELRRAGVRSGGDGIHTSLYDADDPRMRVGLSDAVRRGEANYEWDGAMDVALERLGTVPDGAGRVRLWAAFPDRTRSHRELVAELERVGARAFAYTPEGPDRVVLLGVSRAGHPGEPGWEWSGSMEEALRRLREVPVGAGHGGVWDAFPDRIPSVGLRVDAELERIGCMGIVVRGPHDGRPTSSLLIHDKPDHTAVEWAWSGNAAEALARLRRLPNGAGRQTLWEAFPDRARSLRVLYAHLRRIEGGEGAIAVWTRSEGAQGVALFEHPARSDWVWRGSLDEAVERLRGVADGSRREGVWAAFPDRVSGSPSDLARLRGPLAQYLEADES
jgi:hypothetical protein